MVVVVIVIIMKLHTKYKH